LNSFVHKNILAEKNFKKSLIFNRENEDLVFQLDSLSEILDYALFIRPDLFPISIIEKIKTKSSLTVGYQWDGLKRYPNIYPRINLFDRFFVFDPQDLKNKNTMPITNFFTSGITISEPTYDIYFIGSYIPERMDDIYDFFNLISDQSLRINASIYTNSKKISHTITQKCDTLDVRSLPVSFDENINYVSKSKVIVDFSNYAHHGLSFRVFEALGNNKKLITTQVSIKYYEFYNSKNILILTKNTTKDEIVDFINSAYIPVDEKLKAKYSFENWINYVLNSSYHTPIPLPILD
ncbi:hypothetical protein ORI89_17980, partial [Sphingobacterium sp. UT-1RO-CII-1]|uniref:hypothetical protein n=1 Tax=Sphingobacterium sp. UT-1RO-CII-1 TaxID=2995225 RepID=UPI0022A24158|nr:hypothetical protein [Sphingobacterium sp. UT-1RO-CII-1]